MSYTKNTWTHHKHKRFIMLNKAIEVLKNEKEEN